jgi:hypothetical protein
MDSPELILSIPRAPLCLIPVAGLVGLLRSRETEYHFRGDERGLYINSKEMNVGYQCRSGMKSVR